MILKKKNIIITGALGQDGTILSKLLDTRKYKIIGFVRSSKGKKIKNVTYKRINLLKKNSISKTINDLKPIALVHFGSENPSFYESNKLKKDFYQKNFKSTKNLIDCFVKFKSGKLILIGSSQMYKDKNIRINLKTKFTPSTPYTRFRIDSFKYMIKQKRKHKSNMVMAILFNHDSIYRNKKFLIPRLVKIIKSKNFNKLQEIYLGAFSDVYFADSSVNSNTISDSFAYVNADFDAWRRALPGRRQQSGQALLGGLRGTSNMLHRLVLNLDILSPGFSWLRSRPQDTPQLS